MSFVIAAPDLVENAARDLTAIRSSLAEATTAAARPTAGLLSAAQDEVSIAIATMFGGYGEQFQALTAQASAFHAEFISLISSSAGAYTSAEAANAAQTLLDGGVFGNIEQSVSGAISGAESSFGQLGLNINGGFTALSNGSLRAALSGQIQANVNLGLTAIPNVPVNFAGAIQTGGQAMSQFNAGFGAQLGALEAGGAPGLVGSLGALGSSIAGPYEALVTNTVSNLQTLGGGLFTNPFPFLHQVVNNQIYYAQNIASAIGNGIANLPTELANLPATIQSAVQGLLGFNPLTYVQQFVNQQIGYSQTLVTGLQSTGADLAAGLQQLPAGFQAAFQDLLVGDNISAYNAVNNALINGLFPSLNVVEIGSTGIFDAIPVGPLGDLLPILSIPGQMAQNLTNLLPAGSIPALVAQNATNLVSAATNLGTTINLNGPAALVSFGIPLQLILDAVGGPANVLSALNSSAVSFTTALQAGNVSGALAAVLDAPANAANGFLNGTTYINLPPALLDGIISDTLTLPLGGILTPLSIPGSTASILGMTSPFPLAAGSTEIGGLIPGLLSFGAQFAQDIALPAPVLPSFVF